MTEEELRAREQRARTEYPQTKAAFDRVRGAAMSKMFATKPGEHEKREELYRLVAILNSVEQELLAATGMGSDAIDAYVQSITGDNATTGNR